jgi:hypothetical protein
MQLSLLTTDATLNRFGRFARLVGGNTSDGGDFLRSDAHGLDLSARNRAERPMRLTIRFGGGSSPSRSPHFGASLVSPLACSFGAWDYQPAASLNKVAENLKGYSDGGIITATKPWPRPLPGIVLLDHVGYGSRASGGCLRRGTCCSPHRRRRCIALVANYREGLHFHVIPSSSDKGLAGHNACTYRPA